MRTSKVGVNLIKEFEGCKLKAYLCPAGKPTIGYGNTFYENNKEVKLGDEISQKRADSLLLNLLPKFEKIVTNKVKKELNQNQYDALVSYTWNTGGSNTLFTLINSSASKEAIYTWFITKYITADGIVKPGLIRRRKAEATLYFKEV